MATVFIGMGSNLGDRRGHLAAARAALEAMEATAVTGFSDVYETDPVGPVAQGRFLNAAARLETALEPAALLGNLRAIECAAGRDDENGRVKWGPRPLDLDVLFYDDRVINEPGLTVPHPRLHERWFVLRPLADIDANWVHPTLRKTVGRMLSEVEAAVGSRQ